METVIRVLVVYLFLLFGLRVMGKREFAELSPLELVTLMLIPELVSQALVRGEASIVNGLVGVATLLVLTFLTSLLQHRSQRVSTALTGRPSVLVAHGRLLPDVLNTERITPDEVLAEAHRAGLERIEDVRWALLETDGRISIVPEPGEAGGNPEGATSEVERPI